MNEIILDRKILLVDDEIELLRLMETVLRKEGFRRILKSTNGIEAIHLCKNEKIDIMVLDVMMKGIDGFETCKKIREFSIIPIIFLSAKNEDIDKIMALGMGADDYVTKPFSPKEVAYRIKAHLRRNLYIENEIYSGSENKIEIGDVTCDFLRGEMIKNGENISFTPREYKLLKYMTENSNMILSKEMICDRVWGDDFQGYDNTIMVHIRKLREKIEENPSKPKYILTIKGLGYKLKIGD